MRKQKLPRGVIRRRSSLVISFADGNGVIQRISLGDSATIDEAVTKRAEYREQVRKGEFFQDVDSSTVVAAVTPGGTNLELTLTKGESA